MLEPQYLVFVKFAILSGSRLHNLFLYRWLFILIFYINFNLDFRAIIRTDNISYNLIDNYLAVFLYGLFYMYLYKIILRVIWEIIYRSVKLKGNSPYKNSIFISKICKNLFSIYFLIMELGKLLENTVDDIHPEEN